jgi:diaminopimelate decarboxylase
MLRAISAVASTPPAWRKSGNASHAVSPGPISSAPLRSKSETLLRLCLANDVTVIIDNDDEVELIAALARGAGRKATIGIRVSGFDHHGQRLHSRFGFGIERLAALLERLRGSFADAFTLTGLHFHLNGYDADHRISALRQLLPFALALEQAGEKPVFIDIGGGLPMRYLEEPAQWDAWLDAHQTALLGAGEPITIHNHGIGRIVHEGKVFGEIDAYPTGHDLIQEAWLARILDAGFEGETIAAALRDNSIELRAEPGRSVLDGCGLTAARVQFRKRDTRGNGIVGVAMNRTQCRTGFAEFMLDPVLVPGTPEREPSTPFEGYIAGTYCTESEWISLRRHHFENGVEVGDVLVFPNTAGYLMHFLESRSHQFDLAGNLFLSDDQGAESIRLDDIDVGEGHAERP